MTLINELSNKFKLNQYSIFGDGAEGYWSNLSREENRLMLEALANDTTRGVLLKHQPWLEEIIYSPKRQGGLELLGLKGNETCIDYGCMWGALTIPLAKRSGFVLGIDQTMDSLRFLRARIKEENLSNISLLCLDLNKMPILENKVDVAIINGVLEWIPEHGVIELKSYYGKPDWKEYRKNPRQAQIRFLRRVRQNLKETGKLYLAIENRYDFKMFLGVKDPHANLLFTSYLPRKIADLISIAKLGRPYVNWLYSFKGVEQILRESGCSKVDLYMCFPNYRFPERIIPYSLPLRDLPLTISSENHQGKKTLKRLVARFFEYVIFRIFKAQFLAPSIIAIGHK
jgi:tRNA G46 methylase TrmB